jgi:hypothetical protein
MEVAGRLSNSCVSRPAAGLVMLLPRFMCSALQTDASTRFFMKAIGTAIVVCTAVRMSAGLCRIGQDQT